MAITTVKGAVWNPTDNDFTSPATGAAERTLQSKFEDALSVKDFGAVGDGVTDDTSELEAAFVAANAATDILFFPAGTYLVSSNITNFHTIRKRGPGKVKFGTTTFSVDIEHGERNDLYVATTGSDSNMGLDPTNPVATFQKLFDICAEYGPTLIGRWFLNVAAGTYTEGAVWPAGIRSTTNLEIAGPNVGGHPNVPTAILDGTTATADIGLLFSQYTRTVVDSVKFINWDDTTESAGLQAQVHSYLLARNVHCDSNTFGILAKLVVDLDVEGGIYNANVNGIACQTLVSYTVGHNNVGANLTNNTSAGFRAQEMCSGHVDFSTVDDNLRGLDITAVSRVSASSNDFERNTTAILMRDNSSIFQSSNTFNSATADKNDINLNLLSSSYEETQSAENQTDSHSFIDTAGFSHTGTLVETTLISRTITGAAFVFEGKVLKIIGSGFFDNAGTKTIRAKLAGQTIGTLVSVGSGFQQFRYEFTLAHSGTTNSNTQRGNGILLINGQSPVLSNTSTVSAVLDTDGGKTLELTVELSNVAGVMTQQISDIVETIPN